MEMRLMSLRTQLFLLCLAVIAVSISACNVCLPGQRCVTADPTDTIETIQCLDNSTTFAGSDPVCSFSMNDCGDGNVYQITCSDANNCACRRSNSDGSVDTSEFALVASCVEFTTDDGKRMSEFVETNCGWNIIIP